MVIGWLGRMVILQTEPAEEEPSLVPDPVTTRRRQVAVIAAAEVPVRAPVVTPTAAQVMIQSEHQL